MRTVLREPRSRLVALYGILVALGYTIHALPGGIRYERGAGEYVFWIVVDVILLAFIASGSRVAAAFVLVLNLVFLLSVPLALAGGDLLQADLLAFEVVLLAQCAVLLRLLFRPRGAPAPA